MSARIDAPPQPTPDSASPAGSLSLYLLLASDDAAAAAAMRETFARDFFACDLVRVADDAARAFAVRDYDCILLNLRTPLRSRYDLDAVKAIRSMERHFPEPRVPMFIFSENVSAEDRALAQEAGADDIIPNAKILDALRERLAAATAERRTPTEMIPREPVNYPALLAACGRDESLAQRMIETFARTMDETIRDARTALAAKDVALLRRVAEHLRQNAAHAMSGRVQRAAFLLTKIDVGPQMKDRGDELLRDLEKAEKDLAVWRELELGRALSGVKPKPRPIHTHMLKLSHFLKSRLDIFSRSPSSAERKT